MPDQVVSTGRGGSGNIGKDPHTYVDAGIVREGEQESKEGSTGRGGAGNIGSPNTSAAAGGHPSEDVIPEVSLRPHQDDYHTGRGGQGNVHREKYGGHSHDPETHKSVGEKIKGLLHKEEKKPDSEHGA